MRSIIAFAIALMLCSVASAQYLEPRLPSGPQIAEGAARSFAELEAKVAELEAENAALKACQCCKCDGCECGKAKAQKPYAKLTMVWMSGCDTCEKWWKEQRPRYEARGWAVDRPEKAEALNKTYPYWRVCIGDSCKEIPWVQFNQLDAKVQAIVDAQQ